MIEFFEKSLWWWQRVISHFDGRLNWNKDTHVHHPFLDFADTENLKLYYRHGAIQDIFRLNG